MLHVPGEQNAVSLETDAGNQRVRHSDRLAFGLERPPHVCSVEAGGSTTLLTFGEDVKHDTVAERVTAALVDEGLPDALIELTNPSYRRGSEQRFSEWTLRIALDPQETEGVLTELNSQLAGAPVFPSSNRIGGRVAGDTQAQAAGFLFASLLCMVGYIWIRFQRAMYGLAAVVALVHDVLITLGMIALSAFLVSFVTPLADVLLIDPFKISLPIVAAFLTIIGYSLNDTIVVFDRIREVRGKSPNLSAPMINTSLNQTLSRTLLTSLTTLIVVGILYIFGGQGIHGFAFALVIGVLAGTYSSIFIASPVLLWMSGASCSHPGIRSEGSSRSVEHNWPKHSSLQRNTAGRYPYLKKHWGSWSRSVPIRITGIFAMLALTSRGRLQGSGDYPKPNRIFAGQ